MISSDPSRKKKKTKNHLKKSLTEEGTLSHPMMGGYTDWNNKISDANRLYEINVKNVAPRGRVSRPRRCQVVPEPHHFLSAMVTEDVLVIAHINDGGFTSVNNST